MQVFTFSQMKIQILEVIDAENGLTDGAKSIAFYLVLSCCKGSLGLAAVRDSDIAKAKSCSTDKVSRAVKSLSASGVFEIKRGRWNLMTEYQLSERVWNEATRRRGLPRNIADLPMKYTQQNRDQDPSKIPNKTLQNSGPLKSKKTRDLINQELLVPSFIVDDAGFGLKQWDEFLSKSGLGSLKTSLPLVCFQGVEGFWVPGLWPIFTEGVEKEHQKAWLKKAAKDFQMAKAEGTNDD